MYIETLYENKISLIYFLHIARVHDMITCINAIYMPDKSIQFPHPVQTNLQN